MSDFFQSAIANSGPVECLGQKFPSEQDRRQHFTKLLAEKLKDPTFRYVEGFRLGTDEAILAMSDPPYYTACPNPFLEDFVRHCGKPYDPSVKYSREPQTVDVTVGKTDAPTSRNCAVHPALHGARRHRSRCLWWIRDDGGCRAMVWNSTSNVPA